MSMLIVIVVLCVGIISAQQQPNPPAPNKLPNFFNDGHNHQITLSGFSSGGNLAQQIQFSYPHIFDGVGVFSHTFYRCGPGNGKVVDYDRACTLLRHGNVTNGEPYSPERAHLDIQDYLNRGLIGNPNYLKNKRLYINVPLRSFVYTPDMSLNIVKVYDRYIQNPLAIKTRVQDSNLVVPTNNNYGPPCTQNSSVERAYLGNCGFSGAYDALSFLLGEHRVPNQPSGEKIQLQPLYEFDQEEFSQGIDNVNVDKIGYLYVPRACQANSIPCAVHFYFHGCRTGREHQGMKHVENNGFLEVAELNNIIMVFPQAASSLPENMSGCWDSFGIGGRLYATRNGPQVRVVTRMIKRVIGSGFYEENAQGQDHRLFARDLNNEAFDDGRGAQTFSFPEYTDVQPPWNNFFPFY